MPNGAAGTPAAAKGPERGPLATALWLPTYVGDDLSAVREVARQNLRLFTMLPFFQRLFRARGAGEGGAR